MKALRVQSKLQRAKPVEGRPDPSLKPMAPALEPSPNIDLGFLWQGIWWLDNNGSVVQDQDSGISPFNYLFNIFLEEWLRFPWRMGRDEGPLVAASCLFLTLRSHSVLAPDLYNPPRKAKVLSWPAPSSWEGNSVTLWLLKHTPFWVLFPTAGSLLNHLFQWYIACYLRGFLRSSVIITCTEIFFLDPSVNLEIL